MPALPNLRMNLDFMPSPVEERPGLLIRDSYRYSDVTLIVPPVLVNVLQFYDGEHTELDISAELVRITGQLEVSEVVRHLTESLDAAGFLENETYAAMKAERETEFANSPVREASHAGSAYPDELHPLKETTSRYMGQDGAASGKPVAGIAAPHVSPEGGWLSYRAAYRALSREDRDRTFVILGTSPYGQPERFGLTRKPFNTPFGAAITDGKLVDELESTGGPAVKMEDYCHSFEHSIEFQVVFLQHLFGPEVRILPILCGSYAESIYKGGMPEDDEGVRRFLGVLGDIAAREGRRLCWILGVDMAHMGRRYGDRFSAYADRGEMAGVAERDRERLERLNQGDTRGFWDLVQHNQDDLKWCGSSPFYTFSRVLPQARGSVLEYQQWNIDSQSVVSFAGVAFND